ncbi:Max-like protein X [Sugiyamaella lignohabitans]|uniref:Max-like protein X n=1 Tax=Sugiyamaella lignohabitans TaxID=796027 RepID=A0A167FDI5_9ASCO|nr:Max-like protein X [Sugiyamaella lignohabitans]ANB15162.1 Max-like protein X [Sugiyamaella lignohabitans]
MKEDLSMSPSSALPPLTLPPSALPTPPATSMILPDYPQKVKREQAADESDEDKYFDEDDDIEENEDGEYSPKIRTGENGTPTSGQLSFNGNANSLHGLAAAAGRRRGSVSINSSTPNSAIINSQQTPRYGPTTGTPLIDHPKEEPSYTPSANVTPGSSTMSMNGNHSFASVDSLPPLTLPQAALASPNDSVLPPPPSRACTIIQTVPSDMTSKKGAQAGGRRKRSKKDEMPIDDEQRKKARRTSHSDIERRRRLKINEQFEALRQLVPACSQLTTAKRGGDIGLHKLDILQESVAFIKHLIECVNTMEKKFQQTSSQAPSPLVLPSISPSTNHTLSNTPIAALPQRPSITSLPSNYSLKPKHHEPASPLTGPHDRPIAAYATSISAPSTAVQSPHMHPTQYQQQQQLPSSITSSPVPSSTDTSKLRISNLVG